jgi:hypothetical protein
VRAMGLIRTISAMVSVQKAKRSTSAMKVTGVIYPTAAAARARAQTARTLGRSRKDDIR